MSAQALAQFEAVTQQAVALNERYVALDQQMQSLQARGQASQDVAEVRAIAEQLYALHDQFVEVWNQAEALGAQADALEQEVTDYLASVRERFDTANGDPVMYADTAADDVMESAQDFEGWADEQDAEAAGRFSRAYA